MMNLKLIWALFRNKRLMIDEITQKNAWKFCHDFELRKHTPEHPSKHKVAWKENGGGRRGQVFVVHNMEEFGQDISSSIRTSYFWGFELLHGILFNKIFWTLTYWKIVVIKWQIYQSQIFKLTNSLFVLPNLKHLHYS